MSESDGDVAGEIEAGGDGVITVSPGESWAAGDLPTLEGVLDGAGLHLLGAVDAPPPLVIPASLFARIQAWDREMAVAAGRRQELMELAIDLLGVDRTAYSANIDLDTGVVTLEPIGPGAP